MCRLAPLRRFWRVTFLFLILSEQIDRHLTALIQFEWNLHSFLKHFRSVEEELIHTAVRVFEGFSLLELVLERLFVMYPRHVSNVERFRIAILCQMTDFAPLRSHQFSVPMLEMSPPLFIGYISITQTTEPRVFCLASLLVLRLSVVPRLLLLASPLEPILVC